jgi:hypothetical protein
VWAGVGRAGPPVLTDQDGRSQGSGKYSRPHHQESGGGSEGLQQRSQDKESQRRTSHVHKPLEATRQSALTLRHEIGQVGLLGCLGHGGAYLDQHERGPNG